MALEYVYKPTKYKTLITTISEGHGIPVEEQEATIASWKPADRTIVFGNHAMKDFFGLRQKEIRNEIPLVREVIGGYLMEIPGGETVAFCDPNVSLGADLDPLYAKIKTGAFERAWGASDSLRLFVMDATVLAHMLQEVPYNMPWIGGDQTWQQFMDSWFRLRLPPHKYLDITGLGLVEDKPQEEVVIEKEPDIIGATVVKKKRGRPSKNA